MKKKIIYISGADVFDVHDVRAAFEEVRTMLHLDSDTILFGVPVDAESAAAEPTNVVTESFDNTETAVISEPEPVIQDKQTTESEIVENIEPAIANANDTDTDAPIVPIQSVLTAGTKKTKNSTLRKKKIIEPVVSTPPEIIETETVEITECDSVEPVVTDTVPDEIDVQSTDIETMITDDIPDEPKEKTLEELLESMTPLQEDVQPDDVQDTAPENIDEIDATLENLASEFADTQTKIPSGKKGTSRGGRIGKLKNILPLPFSGKKKDDTGLMGDLFGWAGIAANDEDFTIPGFFTNAAAKK